jgi:hypothetical protein
MVQIKKNILMKKQNMAECKLFLEKTNWYGLGQYG